MQEQKLLNHEEQEEHDRQTSEKKILQELHEAYNAQGDKGVKSVTGDLVVITGQIRQPLIGTCFSLTGKKRPVALTARASDSKSEGWGFESLLACHELRTK